MRDFTIDFSLLKKQREALRKSNMKQPEKDGLWELLHMLEDCKGEAVRIAPGKYNPKEQLF